jgi:methionyl-tRNA formyltransferase
MRILFWGSSEFSIPSLEALSLEYDIAAVITNRDSVCGRGMKNVCETDVKSFAIAHKIPIIQPASLKEEGFKEQMLGLKPDLSVVVSFGMILPEYLLSIPKFSSINLHASLLPLYRGASPIQAALANGDTVTGVTVQYMVKEVDRGDILLQRRVDIRPEDNYQILSEKLAQEGAKLLLEAVKGIEGGNIKAVRQDNSSASFSRMLKKNDGLVDFAKQSSSEIYNKWRAYFPWPGIFTVYNGTSGRINITLLEINKTAHGRPKGRPGFICSADKKGLIVECREGFLSLLKLKPWGKKEMDYKSFINGYRPVIGRIF